MEQRYCQSCGMPLTDDELGTNADGSKNNDYCSHCYQNGVFVSNCTMDDMIEHGSQFVDKYNKHTGNHLTREQFKASLKIFFPMLKRWRG